MGLFSKVGKAFKSVFKGVGKIFKKIMKPIGKFLNSKIGKVLFTVVGVVTMGTALAAGASAWSAAGAVQGATLTSKFTAAAGGFGRSLVGMAQKDVAGSTAGVGAGAGGQAVGAGTSALPAASTGVTEAAGGVAEIGGAAVEGAQAAGSAANKGFSIMDHLTSGSVNRAAADSVSKVSNLLDSNWQPSKSLLQKATGAGSKLLGAATSERGFNLIGNMLMGAAESSERRKDRSYSDKQYRQRTEEFEEADLGNTLDFSVRAPRFRMPTSRTVQSTAGTRP